MTAPHPTAPMTEQPTSHLLKMEQRAEALLQEALMPEDGRVERAIREYGEACADLGALAARDAMTAAFDRERARTCAWSVDTWGEGLWSSACGEEWTFIADGPVENGCIYCHHCGGKVVVVLPLEEPTDDE